VLRDKSSRIVYVSVEEKEEEEKGEDEEEIMVKA
jgi:hypothetical protein